MTAKAQYVFRSLNSYHVISKLKLPLISKGGNFFTPHPKSPEHLYQLEQNELVGVGYESPTPAMHLFDFLSLKLGSYEKAIDFVSEEYHNLASIPSGITLESIRDPMVEGLKSDRQQFEEILDLRNAMRDRTDNLQGAWLYCRKLAISPDHAWRMFYICYGRQLNRIMHYSGEDDRLESEDVYLVFPYFRNRHTFGLLQIHDLNGKHVRGIKLNPSRQMFFGLHSCLPDNTETRVFGSMNETLVMHSSAMSSGDFKLGFVHLAFDHGGELEPSPLHSGVFMATPDTDINTLVKNHAAFEQFSVADYGRRFAETVAGQEWTIYAVNQVVNAINEDGDYTSRAASMVECLKGDTHVCQSLLHFLLSYGKQKLVEKIKRHIEAKQVYNIGQVEIEESPSGYVARKPGTNVTSVFTNFIIKLDASIWFAESEETYFSGWVVNGGNQAPILLTEDEALSAKAIVTKARCAVQRQGLSQEGNLPLITDLTLSSKLPGIINQQMTRKPSRPGVQRLGWNKTKSSFTTPTWEAQPLKITTTSRVIHPEANTIASFYSTRPFVFKTASSDKVTPQARYLIALVVSAMTRAFLNQQVSVVSLIRSPESLNLLKAVFRPLGQIRPIELSPNHRAVVDTLSAKNFSGYPVFATCPDPEAVDGINFPLFFLSESGFPLHEPMPEDLSNHISAFSHQILSALAMDFVRNSEQAHSLITNEDAPSFKEMAMEGKRIIEARCGIANFSLFEPELPLLQSILSQVDLANINRVFRYDLESSMVYISCRKLKDVTREPLFEELSQKNPDVRNHNDHYIACPAAWFVDLLGKFYGKPVKMYHQAEVKEVPGGSAPSEISSKLPSR